MNFISIDLMSESSTKKLIKEIESLPVEERAMVAESVLESLNPVDANIEKRWIDIAEERLKEIKSGKVKAIEGDRVFDRIQRRFSK
ncbi:addiction module protein [Rhodohalobacter sp. 614A]|uniref:addiction module protein n=1 Tax=Rhodohalobacter sp. 614A TaxID=2908649 RepID=UPI001F301458|nr:addiction module protein [Rhodohalobacter sp. 614A]